MSQQEIESSVLSDVLKYIEQEFVIQQYDSLLALYLETLRIVNDLIKETSSGKKKKEFIAKAEKYRTRAAIIKTLIQSKKIGGKFREQIKIEDREIGFGYATVFGRFFDAAVTHINIEEPYIRTYHQCQNLVRFCELGVKKCKSLSKITLLTRYADQEYHKEQVSRLHELRLSLNARKITFAFSFSSTLHDRQIKLNNGWVIKIGRGLDYFHSSSGKYTIGNCDLELRPCLETTIDIFYLYNQS